MKELELKYGCNPNQKPSRIFMEEGELPIKVLNGKPGYINFLDAFKRLQVFLLLLLLSMFLLPVPQLVFLLVMLKLRFTG